MKKLKQIVLCLSLLLGMGVASAEPSALYPFNVMIGGQTAEAESPSALFAKIKEPVAANASIKADIETTMVIINAFPCDAAGTPVPGGQPAIIMIQGGNQSALSKTLDGKKLQPGSYVANIVAEGKTSRVFFTVK